MNLSMEEAIKTGVAIKANNLIFLQIDKLMIYVAQG